MTRLFQEQNFIGHSGDPLKWKIECDALSSNEWKCISTMIMEYETRPFCSAIGIPRGGIALSRFLNDKGSFLLSQTYDFISFSFEFILFYYRSYIF